MTEKAIETGTEYTHKTGMSNLYGKAMFATSTNVFFNKGKVLQYLTNELFEAAQADLQEDKKSNTTREQIEKGEGSTKNYDIFINRLATKIQKTPEDTKKLLESAKDSKGESIFKKNYDELKFELDKTRVFGVGKGISEKAVTLASNSARVVLKTIGTAVALLALAAVATLTDGMGGGTELGVGTGGLNPARSASTAGSLRGQLKDTLSKSLENEELSVKRRGIKAFMGKLWHGEKYEASYQKPVLKNKLWKQKNIKSQGI